MMRKVYIRVCFLLVICNFNGCVEPFDAETQVFEDTLVVDARLTDEKKHHVVLLSRARPFEQDSISAERNAKIVISDNASNSYDFTEVEPGRYESNFEFEGKQNTDYQLTITTVNGSSYRSERVTTPESTAIEDLYVERETNDKGEDGVAIFLDSDSDVNNLKYFRYEYEETYKIIAPVYDPFEFEIIDDVACADGDAFEVGIKSRTEDQEVCFASRSSTDVVLKSTSDLLNNTISRFLVRFIEKNDFIISHRYSILVRQFAQTQEAFSYYEDLESFSSSDNVFSETQPGFLNGNIISDANDQEKIIGYFEVTSVSEKRVFFNYSDLFPNEPLPPYPINCNSFGNPRLIPQGYHCDGLVCDGKCTSPLIEAIKGNTVVFFAENDDDPFIAPYFTQPRACGDCTVFGSTEVPDFWTE